MSRKQVGAAPSTAVETPTMANLPVGGIDPTDVGLVGWNFPLYTTNQSFALATNGLVYVSRIRTLQPITVSNLHAYVVTAGATLTASQNLMALYSSAKALLATTADQSTAWTTTGLKTAAVTPQSIPTGYFYVAMFANGTTKPAMARAQLQNVAINGLLSAANSMWATADTGQTTAFPSTLGTFTASGNGIWAGVS